ISLRQRLMKEVDDELAGRIARFEQFFRIESAESSTEAQLRDELEEFCEALPSDSFVSVSGVGFTFEHGAALAERNANLRTKRESFTYNGRRYDLEVGASVTEPFHTLELLRLLLVGLLPVVMIVACLGAIWVARHALKPVQEIISAAQAISIENLSDRLPVPQ